MHRIIFDEIIKLPKAIKLTSSESMMIVRRYVQVTIEMDENHNLFYCANLDSLLESDIDNDTMVKIIVDGGWELSSDNTKLIKYSE